jgi:hypothetical protein
MPTYLSDEDIDKAPEINGDVARLVLAEATIQLQDQLETKKAFEAKAAVLLGALVTITIAVLGAGAINKGELQHEQWLAGPAFFLVSGAGFIVFALFDKPYGSPGVLPHECLTEFWLLPGKAGERPADKLAALLAWQLQKHIVQSKKSNDRKAELIAAGIALGMIGAALTACTAIWELFSAAP